MKLEEAMAYNDTALEALKPSELLRAIIPHALMYDQWVHSAPGRYVWDMGVWWRAAHDLCSACMAGSVLAVRGDVEGKCNEVWRDRVDHLRVGNLWEALTDDQRDSVESKQMHEVAKWFYDHVPDYSAAGGLVWNSEEDPAFYAGYAAMLAEVGL